MYYNMEESGKRIQQLRIQHTYTQEEFAEALNIGRSFLSRIEAGKKGCSIDLLIQLSELFNVSLDYIIVGRSNGPAPEARKQLKDDIAELISHLERFQSNL